MPLGAALAFNQAFKKIQARQQEEIAYLTEHHPAVMAKDECALAIQQNKSVSLKSLEAKNTLLDASNSEIITSKIIDINSTELTLRGAHITRLPVTLFQAERYVNFWKNLTELNCRNNQLTALNVQGLAALQRLWCDYNQLTALDLRGLVALQYLWCHNNQLTELNVQGLVALQALICSNNQLTALNVHGLALQGLYCDNNPLTDLNLTGAPTAIKNKYAELEKILLFKQLIPSNSVEVRREIIARLGASYTRENCENYCPEHVNILFASDAIPISVSDSKTSTDLPSASPQQERLNDGALIETQVAQGNELRPSAYGAFRLFFSHPISQVYNLASSALSQFSAYLPSSASASGNNSSANSQRKRPRDEGQEQDDNQMDQEENSSATEEKKPDDEPKAKYPRNS